MASTKWKLLESRPFDWAMKSLESAETGMNTLADGRLELTIRHDIIKDVTPAMLGWWFRNIDATMEYRGKIYPRYLVWHPIDHIHFKVARRAPDGTAGPGARFHLVEALGVSVRRSHLAERVSMSAMERRYLPWADRSTSPSSSTGST